MEKLIWKPVSEVYTISTDTGEGNTLPLYNKANALVVQARGDVYWQRNSAEASSSVGFKLPNGIIDVLWYNFEEGDYVSYWIEPGSTLTLQFALG